MPFWKERTADRGAREAEPCDGVDVPDGDGGAHREDSPPQVLPRFPFVSLQEMEESRESFRIPMTVPVKVSAASRTFSTTTVNCSLGGMAFLSGDEMARGAQIEIEATLDGTDLALLAEVRHSAPGDGRHVVGVRFASLSGGAERVIARAIAAQDRRLHVRARVTTGIQYKVLGRSGPFRVTTSSDVCLGGVRFDAADLRLGDRVELLAPFAHSLRVYGTVIRVDQDDDGTHAAVCFDSHAHQSGHAGGEDALVTSIRTFLEAEMAN